MYNALPNPSEEPPTWAGTTSPSSSDGRSDGSSGDDDDGDEFGYMENSGFEDIGGDLQYYVHGSSSSSFGSEASDVEQAWMYDVGSSSSDMGAGESMTSSHDSVSTLWTDEPSSGEEYWSSSDESPVSRLESLAGADQLSSESAASAARLMAGSWFTSKPAVPPHSTTFPAAASKRGRPRSAPLRAEPSDAVANPVSLPGGSALARGAVKLPLPPHEGAAPPGNAAVAAAAAAAAAAADAEDYGAADALLLDMSGGLVAWGCV